MLPDIELVNAAACLLDLSIDPHEGPWQKLLADRVAHDAAVDISCFLLHLGIHYKQNLHQLGDQVVIGGVAGMAEHGEEPGHQPRVHHGGRCMR